ncbi:uncharacterized protein LOC111277734 isoform X3 [Durio zibethinus]|uniref:Uncharacterized protein LOC111277734 isoform X3 n=1 Tax=Durio zibethinus TaxID=66656 RepID=A0A6P5WUY5_DURZI|nr:uncharacterized protein LOC111277734 isoform X3 [Durio zibethinus]
MKGTKRFAISGSAADTNDFAFRNKRIMSGSPFEAQRAEPWQQQSTATPPLDPQRAELSQQHVKALNNQFASWVQLQLKNHPDELWQDGVQDYLTHASNIMEKFSDVFNWLKANAVNGDSLYAESHKNESKVVPEAKKTETKFFQGKTGFTPISTTTGFSPGTTTPSFSPAGSNSSFTFGGTTTNFTSVSTTTSFTSPGMTTSFATPWSSGAFSNSPTPNLFGTQSSVAMNNNVLEDADDENELPQPSSPSVKKSEEKGIVVVHEVKCKLYVKSTDPADKDSWKDRGSGQLSIKCKEGISKGSKDSKPTIVVRNDVGKVILNALLYPGMKTSAQKNSLVAIFHTLDDGGNSDNAVARTFLIRTKSEEDRNKLAAVIQEYAPAF